MIQDFLITTDSTCDLTKNYLDQHNTTCIFSPCIIDGIVYTQKNELSAKELFEKLQHTSSFSTSQFNPEDVQKTWESILNSGQNILHISISSLLSGSYNSCQGIAKKLLLKYPHRQIAIIDTLSTFAGEGYILDCAIQMRVQGNTLSETITWIEAHKKEFCLLIAVDDLSYFNRGGRVIDKLPYIKPIVHHTSEGRLEIVHKVRGRKRSIKTLIDMMEERVKNYPEKRRNFLLSHGNCPEEAAYVAEHIKERMGYEEYLLFPQRMTSCIHSGPGAITLGFMGSFQ